MLHILPCGFAGNPLTHAILKRGAPIQTASNFAAQPRRAARHARKKSDIQFARRCFHQAEFNFDPCGA